MLRIDARWVAVCGDTCRGSLLLTPSLVPRQSRPARTCSLLGDEPHRADFGLDARHVLK